MNKVLALLVYVAAGAHSQLALAHGGGLDRHGCHHNRKTGGYHCHRSPPTTFIAPTLVQVPPLQPATPQPQSQLTPITPMSAQVKAGSLFRCDTGTTRTYVKQPIPGANCKAISYSVGRSSSTPAGVANKVSALDEKPGWEVVGKSAAGAVFAAKRDLLKLSTVAGYGDVVEQIAEWRVASPPSLTVEKWRVRLSDCEAGFGALYVLDLNGYMTSQTAFVSGGSSVASVIADYLCARSSGN